MARVTKKQVYVEKEEVPSPGGRLRRLGVIKSLAFVFFVIWIVIGLAVLGLIYQFSKGKLSNYVIFSKIPEQSQANPEPPAEMTLPKIGKINIACAEKALKPESIQKLVGEFDYDITKLSGEEKTEFEKCIVEPPQPSPTS